MQSVRCAKRAAVLAENDEQEEGEASDWGRDGERRTREVSGGVTACWDSRGRMARGLQTRTVGDGVERRLL